MSPNSNGIPWPLTQLRPVLVFLRLQSWEKEKCSLSFFSHPSLPLPMGYNLPTHRSLGLPRRHPQFPGVAKEDVSTYHLAIKQIAAGKKFSSQGSSVGKNEAVPGKLRREYTGTASALGVAFLPTAAPLRGGHHVPWLGSCAPTPLSQSSCVAFASPPPDLSRAP